MRQMMNRFSRLARILVAAYLRRDRRQAKRSEPSWA